MSKTLNQLCADWLTAKAKEDAAKAARIDIEKQMESLVALKPEGSKTIHDGKFTISFKTGKNYKMDWVKWEEVKASIPENIHPVKMKPEVDETGVRWLRDNNPQAYALLPMTVSDAKTGVSIKVAE